MVFWMIGRMASTRRGVKTSWSRLRMRWCVGLSVSSSRLVSKSRNGVAAALRGQAAHVDVELVRRKPLIAQQGVDVRITAYEPGAARLVPANGQLPEQTAIGRIGIGNELRGGEVEDIHRGLSKHVIPLVWYLYLPPDSFCRAVMASSNSSPT